jgi:hypothetical protein
MTNDHSANEVIQRIGRSRIPLLAIGMLVGILGEALHWGFPLSLAAAVGSQAVLIIFLLP